jgi:short-subunit dehydrogenase
VTTITNGNYALITGASGGIGLELAKEFAKNNINVVVVARSESKLQSLASLLQQQYKVQVKVITKDLSKLEEVEALYQQLKYENITVDYLVNNAGFGDYAYFYEADWNKLNEMINLNITALTRLSYLFVKDMVQQGFGKIMNVASTAAFQPGPTMAVYYATKSYVLFLSEAMANELQDKGVTVTALCPGATESGFEVAAALKESKLFKGKKLPSSAEVAAYGYKAMMKGKMVAIHGLMNNIMAQSIRFAPRALVLKIVRNIQSKV